MSIFKSFEQQAQSVNDNNFTQIALGLFRFQAKNNLVYAEYLHHLACDIDKVNSLQKIPFLPISFFKSKAIKTGHWQEEQIFESSGTTGTQTSKHYVLSLDYYLQNATECFQKYYGPLTQYHFFALLPAYLERKNSSLVVMMDYFIRESKSNYSGFYLYNTAEMLQQVDKARMDNRKIILWGVSFALMDLAEQYRPDLSDCIIMETGGMKGRRTEITRAEMHGILCEAFKVGETHSEYGMTELMSQAYSGANGIFKCPPSMRVLIRDTYDPFSYIADGQTGGINVVDLANVHTCAFIETEDLGRIDEEGDFEVLGRFDQSDMRGCNLMLG